MVKTEFHFFFDKKMLHADFTTEIDHNLTVRRKVLVFKLSNDLKSDLPVHVKL
jgi:hypothetical protein